MLTPLSLAFKVKLASIILTPLDFEGSCKLLKLPPNKTVEV